MRAFFRGKEMGVREESPQALIADFGRLSERLKSEIPNSSLSEGDKHDLLLKTNLLVSEFERLQPGAAKNLKGLQKCYSELQEVGNRVDTVSSSLTLIEKMLSDIEGLRKEAQVLYTDDRISKKSAEDALNSLGRLEVSIMEIARSKFSEKKMKESEGELARIRGLVAPE